jgi:hypothetical protein
MASLRRRFTAACSLAGGCDCAKNALAARRRPLVVARRRNVLTIFTAAGLESTMSDDLARKGFAELKERTGLIPDADLDDFWATLEPATIDFMIGEWKGGEFNTGHWANGLLARLDWFGKTFNSATDAKPLVCLDAAGNKYSNIEAMNGEASLWMEEFRGEVTASMVYDGQPVHDHFKKIDENAVMGIMDGKHGLDNGRYGYFYLERV